MRKCFECDCNYSLHKHHVVPKSKGGKRTVWLCEDCHGKVHGLNFLNHKELTKIGLKRAKESGVKLGSPKNLTHTARKKGAQARKANAIKNENNIKSTVEICRLKKSTALSYQNIANELNKKGLLTSGNKKHSARSVQLLYIRAKKITMEEQLKNRFLGCLVGLAVGDAYGTTYEFTNRVQMPAELPNDIVGGGPFEMKPGEWTDDTSMALCLAESIVEKGWDADDQMTRYVRWWQEGYNSVKGECFDIGGATRNALSSYNMTGQFVVDSQAAGNGVLMRLAPVPMFCHDKEDSVYVLSLCAYQSVMTHPSSQSIECSMLMGAIINKILSGERDKMKILNFDTLLDENSKQMYKEVYEKYGCKENGRIESIKRVEYKDAPAEKISGDGYCVYTLEAALWAFLSTDSFVEGLKKVVALGDDTDTTGAVYGQIAGAYYGINGIPWVDKIAWIDKIKKLAEDIYEINKNQ